VGPGRSTPGRGSLATVHVFGLTGGIGSGKSTVAARLIERGLPVVDADALAREVVLPGSPALVEIVISFGRDVLCPDGTLDRRHLAAMVFERDSARQALEAILHPRIRALAGQRFADLEARGEPLACYEVPLLFEKGLDGSVRPVIVVVAPDAVRIDRVVARDGWTEDQARARLRAQLPLADKVARADHIIDNGGSVAATCGATDRVLTAICDALGVDPSRYGLEPIS
jgi:dephospho-CoA kinase